MALHVDTNQSDVELPARGGAVLCSPTSGTSRERLIPAAAATGPPSGFVTLPSRLAPTLMGAGVLALAASAC